jgi:hypothetical protein
MLRKLVSIIGLTGVLISLGAVSAKSVGDDVRFPNGFRDWFVVNSMIVTKDSQFPAKSAARTLSM